MVGGTFVPFNFNQSVFALIRRSALNECEAGQPKGFP